MAAGAAIQAGIIQGTIDSDESIVMTDVNPYTLGVRVATDYSTDHMSVIIPRNVTIPTTRHQVYYTLYDYQNAANIEVYQGESRTASRNHLLGKFLIEGIPEKPAGKESIDVSFSYNQNGMLNVSAMLTSTGREMSIAIDMMESGEKERIDVSDWKSSPFAGDYRSILRRGEKLLKNLQQEEDEESRELARELEDAVYQLKKAVLESDLEKADDYEEDIRNLLDEN